MGTSRVDVEWPDEAAAGEHILYQDPGAARVFCPFCTFQFEETCEYVHNGVGRQQVTGNACPYCGAYEYGAYSIGETVSVIGGWVRH